MAIVKDGKTTVILGLLINFLLVILKFIAYLYSHLNLFFADAIDSIVDSFVIFMILIFLRFNFSNKLTYLNMDILFFCQWCVIIVFRLIIFLEQIADLINPEKRQQPVLLLVVSSIVLFFGILLAILFVDEDDVVKFFIDDKEKALKKQLKAQSGKIKHKKPTWKILPIFAEALDNLVTTLFALLVSILLYLNISVDYLYILDDVSNMVISVVMICLASRGLWELSEKYKNKSYFEPLFTFSKREENQGEIELSNTSRIKVEPEEQAEDDEEKQSLNRS